jgi:hypothetical protein
VLNVIKSIFGNNRRSPLILNEKLSKTSRCLEEEDDAFLLVECIEHNFHDDVLVFDPTKKVLWLRSLNRLHNLKCYF